MAEFQCFQGVRCDGGEDLGDGGVGGEQGFEVGEVGEGREMFWGLGVVG